MKRHAAVLLVALCAGCATTAGAPQGNVRLDGTAIELPALTASDVSHAVQVTTRDGRTIFRGPTLSVTDTVDLRRGGPGLAVNLGMTTMGRSGFLFGVRQGGGARVDYVAYQSDFIEGTKRFASVALADGTPLKLRTTPRNQVGCEPTCLLVFETLVVELPEPALRAAVTDGLPLTITLDNGMATTIRVPAVYVQGYLAAVDAPR